MTISLNTPGFDSKGFKNVGPEQVVYLPDTDSVPVFLVVGDSINAGFSATATDIFPTNAELSETATDGLDYGRFWGKWLENTSGTSWTTAARGTSAIGSHSWERLHSYMGINSTHSSGADFSAFVDVSPLWTFARNIYGMFRYSDDTIALPYFIYLSINGTILGEDTSATNTASWHPDRSGGAGDSKWTLFTEYYLLPAINNLDPTGTSTRPFLCGVVSSLGNNDAMDGTESGAGGFSGVLAGVSEAVKTNLEYFRRQLEDFCGTDQFPWVQCLHWDPELYESDGVTREKFENTLLVRELMLEFQRENTQVVLAEGGGLPRATDNLHPNGQGAMLLGKRYAGAYRELLRSGEPVVAQEITANLT